MGLTSRLSTRSVQSWLTIVMAIANAMKFFPFPLRISIPLILFIFGTVLGCVSIERETSQAFARVEQDLSNNAKFSSQQFASMLEYLYRRGDREQAEIAISHMRSDRNLKFSVLYDEYNRVVLSTDYALRHRSLETTPAAPSATLFTEVRKTLSQQIHISADKQHVQAIYPVLLGAVPGEVRSSRVGILWVEYNASALKQRAVVDAWRRSLLSAASVAVFCILIWIFFEKTLTRRATKLVAATHSLSRGELSRRVHLKGCDELAQIAAAFNHMASQIQINTEALQTSETALKTANETLEMRVQERTAALEAQTTMLTQTLQELQQTQAQLIQSAKMSSLGQLVAGIAHEINNPVNFIHGNVNYAIAYTQDLLALLELYQYHYPHPVEEIAAKLADIELDFLLEDLSKVLVSMQTGTDRIRDIVLSLRNFSRLDESEFKSINLHESIDSTLLILQHRLKPKSNRPEITVLKDYGNLPIVKCYASQFNQAMMHVLVNAIDALDGTFCAPGSACPVPHLPTDDAPQIHIRTLSLNPDWVEIAIADNGPGIPEELQQRIFDPFFTTKAIGKGTGMGMGISYQIITQRHNGKFSCISVPDKGTEFIIQIPIHPSQSQ